MVTCFDEKPFQFLRHVSSPPGRHPPGSRAGVVDVMMRSNPALGLRQCLVTPSRKKVGFHRRVRRD